MSGHIHGRPIANSIFRSPETCCCLILSIEVDTTLAIKTDITKDASLVTTPREHRQRYWNGNINSKLADINLRFKSSGGCTRLSKDGGTIPVFIFIDDFNGVVQRVGLKYD